MRLLVQGVVITLFFLAYVRFYGNLMDFDSIMIGILLFYFCTQVLEHGRPSIYIDDYAIDDIDFVRLDDELQRSVLDGEFASSLTSNDLVGIVKNHAKANAVDVQEVVKE